MENPPQPQLQPPSQPVQLPSRTASSATRDDAEALRKHLEKSKVEVEKLTQKNAASIEYVTRAEKTEKDVAKAADDYKSAFARLQTAKRDTDNTNESESKEAAAKIGASQANVDTAVRTVDQPIAELQKNVADLKQKKAACEAKFGEAQNSLAAAQAALQDSLAYQVKLTESLKAVADIQAKKQKVKDHAHAAEFYFYATEARKKLSEVHVKTPDELNADLNGNLAAVGRAIGDVFRAKADLIDVSVDLDVTQKQLADLEKNREPQILAKIRPYNQPAAKPPEVPAAEPAKQNAPAK